MQKYGALCPENVEPLFEPLGIFLQFLNHFEPPFEPLLFQLFPCFFKINGVGIIFLTDLLVVSKKVRGNITVTETLGEIPPPCMRSTNPILLNPDTNCVAGSAIVLINSVDTKTAISNFSGENISAATGNLVNGIQKVI